MARYTGCFLLNCLAENCVFDQWYINFVAQRNPGCVADCRLEISTITAIPDLGRRRPLECINIAGNGAKLNLYVTSFGHTDYNRRIYKNHNWQINYQQSKPYISLMLHELSVPQIQVPYK